MPQENAVGKVSMEIRAFDADQVAAAKTFHGLGDDVDLELEHFVTAGIEPAEITVHSEG